MSHTSLSAVLAFFKGSAKSPYSTVSWTPLPKPSISCSDGGFEMADATRRAKLLGPSFRTLLSC